MSAPSAPSEAPCPQVRKVGDAVAAADAFACSRRTADVRNGRSGRSSSLVKPVRGSNAWHNRDPLASAGVSIHVALNHVTHYRYDRPVESVAAARPAASGAALPHADPVVLAARRRRPALRQLAAGSAEQLPRAARVSREGPTSSASRSTSSPRWRSTIRSTSSSSRTPSTFPFAYEAVAAARAAAVPPHRAAHAALRPAISRAIASTAPADRSTSWSTSTGSCSRTSATSSASSPACRRPKQTLDAGVGLVPRLGVAAGAAAAPPRARGALRLRLPDSARRPDVKALDGPPAPTATSPTCTPGARSICRAPAGSASIRPRACSPAKATFPLACTPEPASAAPVTGRRRRVRGRVRITR